MGYMQSAIYKVGPPNVSEVGGHRTPISMLQVAINNSSTVVWWGGFSLNQQHHLWGLATLFLAPQNAGWICGQKKETAEHWWQLAPGWFEMWFCWGDRVASDLWIQPHLRSVTGPSRAIQSATDDMVILLKVSADRLKTWQTPCIWYPSKIVP